MQEKRIAKIKLAFLGGGNMAEAILEGVLRSKKYKPAQIMVSDPNTKRLADLAGKYGVETTFANEMAAKAAVVSIVAVKPDKVASVLAECQEDLKKKLVISIAAGVTLSALQAASPKSLFIRVMPNTPALVRAGASVLCIGDGVSPKEAELAKQIFGQIGRVWHVEKEAMLDAVTGLSGSGPAYAYLFLEALSDGGVAMGLDRKTARELAAQTLVGAASMVLESGEHPGELKDRVTSPGGTTIAGVAELENAGFRGTVMRAVKASATRSKELGEEE